MIVVASLLETISFRESVTCSLVMLLVGAASTGLAWLVCKRCGHEWTI